MNKALFYILLFGLALGLTLGIVYFLNLSNPNLSLNEMSNQRVETEVSMPQEFIDIPPISEDSLNTQIIIDSETPQNYNDQELINLEKEINTLDLSGVNDIE